MLALFYRYRELNFPPKHFCHDYYIFFLITSTNSYVLICTACVQIRNNRKIYPFSHNEAISSVMIRKVTLSLSLSHFEEYEGNQKKGELRGEEYLFVFKQLACFLFLFSLTAHVMKLITILFLYFTVLDLLLHHVWVAARLYRKLGFQGRRVWKTSRTVSF